MAVVPIEVVRLGNVATDDVTASLGLANSVQKEFLFIRFPDDQVPNLPIHAYTFAQPWELLNIIENFRRTLRGYHPFLILLVDGYFDDTSGNRSYLAGKGIAAFCSSTQVKNLSTSISTRRPTRTTARSRPFCCLWNNSQRRPPCEKAGFCSQNCVTLNKRRGGFVVAESTSDILALSGGE